MAHQESRLPPELEVDFMLAEATGGEREAFYLALAKVFEELHALRRELRTAPVSETGSPGPQAIRRALGVAADLSRLQARRNWRVHYGAVGAMTAWIVASRYLLPHYEVTQSELAPQLALWEEAAQRTVQYSRQEVPRGPSGSSASTLTMSTVRQSSGTGQQMSTETRTESIRSSGQEERAELTRARVVRAIGLFSAAQLFGAVGVLGLYGLLRFLFEGTTGAIHPYLEAALVPFGFGLAVTAGLALRDVIRGDH